MLLHWPHLALHYGDSAPGGFHPALYEHHFNQAGRLTAGLLCCRYADSTRFEFNQRTAHAEEQLIGISLWRSEIPQAITQADPVGDMINIALILNRSPCRLGTELLIREIRNRPRTRCTRTRFILAMRGAYEGRDPELTTTEHGLRALHHAGWDICVLQMEQNLPPRGMLLLLSLRAILDPGPDHLLLDLPQRKLA